MEIKYMVITDTDLLARYDVFTTLIISIYFNIPLASLLGIRVRHG